MPCKKCDGLGVFFLKVDNEILVNKCEPCIFQYRKPKAISKRKIYESSISLIEHEDQIQWDIDYPFGYDNNSHPIREF